MENNVIVNLTWRFGFDILIVSDEVL